MAASVKISHLLISFSSFHFSCPILEKENFIKNMYIILFCLIKYHSFLIFGSEKLFYKCTCPRGSEN